MTCPTARPSEQICLRNVRAEPQGGSRRREHRRPAEFAELVDVRELRELRELNELKELKELNELKELVGSGYACGEGRHKECSI